MPITLPSLFVTQIPNQIQTLTNLSYFEAITQQCINWHAWRICNVIMFTFLGWIHNFKVYFLPKKLVKLKLIFLLNWQNPFQNKMWIKMIRASNITITEPAYLISKPMKKLKYLMTQKMILIIIIPLIIGTRISNWLNETKMSV